MDPEKVTVCGTVPKVSVDPATAISVTPEKEPKPATLTTPGEPVPERAAMSFAAFKVTVKRPPL